MAKYFTLEELCETTTGLDNTPNDEEKEHLEILMDVLDGVREAWTEKCSENKWGSPSIIVNSGFRSDAVNKAVGGSKTSAHRLGWAADIEPSNQRMKEFQDFVPKYCEENKILFDQIIKEHPINGISSWLHFGLKNKQGQQRKQVFWLN